MTHPLAILTEGVPRSTPAFYFDLASPQAYLVAERILHTMPGPVEWRPVLARELPGLDAGALGAAVRSQLAERARELSLQPLRWPDPFPFDSSLAMRVATYAKSIGRVVPFAQAAFRQAFAGGHSLADPDFVLIAAAACEMHPAAVLRAAELRTVADQLTATTATASRAGVADVPAIVLDGRVYRGEGALEDAAEELVRSRARAGAGPR